MDSMEINVRWSRDREGGEWLGYCSPGATGISDQLFCIVSKAAGGWSADIIRGDVDDLVEAFPKLAQAKAWGVGQLVGMPLA